MLSLSNWKNEEGAMYQGGEMTERRAGFRGSVRNSNLNTQSVRYCLDTQMEPLRSQEYMGVWHSEEREVQAMKIEEITK